MATKKQVDKAHAEFVRLMAEYSYWQEAHSNAARLLPTYVAMKEAGTAMSNASKELGRMNRLFKKAKVNP